MNPGQPAMDLYQLKTFFTAAQTLNYTEAARKLYITQSAVSHAIKKLERSSGEELLRKTGRRLALTDAGRRLYRTCETVFYELEKAREDLQAARGRLEGNIRLGATVEFGNTLLIKHLARFIRKNPSIHIDFFFSDDLLKPLLSDEVDLIIDCLPHGEQDVEKTPLFREEYVVIASPGLAAAERIRRPADLSRCNILSLDKGCGWWKNFLGALPQEERPVFSRVTEINHIRGITNAAAESLGVGFVPKYCVTRELKSGTLKNVFPRLELLEDRFSVYQKTKRSGLERHRRLLQYLSGVKDAQLPGKP